MQEHDLVVVIGLGNIGAIVAAELAAAGRNVLACVRRPLERVRLERPGGAIEVPLRAVLDPALVPRAPWVVLCTKAHQTAGAAAWLAAACGPQTRVAVLQNGIEHRARTAPFAGGATIVPAVVYFNGERFGDERVRLRNAGPVELRVAAGDDGRAFAALFAPTGLRVELTGDFPTHAWRKLLVNAVANPLTALALARQSIFRDPRVQALCRDVLAEAVAVARADGARVSSADIDATIATLASHPADAGTSMYFDRLAGRSLETEALTGAIVAAAERHGVSVPLNRALATLLRVALPPPS